MEITIGLCLKMKKSLIKKIFLKSFYIRIVEERIKLEYKKQLMRCPIHLSIGQELSSSIFGEISKIKDYFISPHRAHAHYLAKNGNLNKFLLELHGKKSGCSGGRGGSMHLIDLDQGFIGSTAIVANTIPIGVGLAQSQKIKKKEGITLIFFGDGAVEEGAFWESLNYAIVKSLPVLFVCENNFFSVYTNLNQRQKNLTISKSLKEMPIKTFFCNDRNVSNTIDICLESYNFVKKNKLPAFIEIETHRFLEHCGPNIDDDLNYKKNVPLIKNFNKDPIKLLKKLCLKSNFISQEEIKSFQKKTNNKLDYIFNNINHFKNPSKKDLYKNIYK